MVIFFTISPVCAAGGSGTAGDPYIITTPAELQAISSDLDAYYVLGNDIDLTGIIWDPIGNVTNPFTGNFDGQNYIISNLYVDFPVDLYGGLFGVFGPNVTAGNIIFRDGNIYTYNYAGCLVGYVKSDNTNTYIDDIKVYNCKIQLYNDSETIAGIVGCVDNSSKYVLIKNISVVNSVFIAQNIYQIGWVMGDNFNYTSIYIDTAYIAHNRGFIIPNINKNNDIYNQSQTMPSPFELSVVVFVVVCNGWFCWWALRWWRRS